MPCVGLGVTGDEAGAQLGSPVDPRIAQLLGEQVRSLARPPVATAALPVARAARAWASSSSARFTGARSGQDGPRATVSASS